MPIDFPRDPYHGEKTRITKTDCYYYYDETRMSWIFLRGGGGGGGGGSQVFVQDDIPLENVFVGSLWVQTPSYFLYVYDNDGRWVGLTNNPEGQTFIHASDNAPANASVNDLWFDTVNSDLRILYKDEDSTQWVTISTSDLSKVIASDDYTKLTGQVEALTVRVSNIEGNPGIIIE